jgi:hypothetical protein
MGMAAAVALLALIGIVTLVRNADDTADVASGVDEVPLTEIAGIASRRADRDLTPGQYLSRAMTEGTTYEQADPLAGGRYVERSEWWLRRDGTGLNRTVESTWVASTPGVAQGAVITEPREVVVTSPQPFFNPGLFYDQLRALPTDPTAMLAAVREANGGDLGDTALDAQVLAWWLAIETVPPLARAAAFEAVGLLGAQPIGGVATPGGRDGVGYQGNGADGRPWILVVDPASTSVIAFARGAGTGDRAFPEATKFYEYGDQRIVDALPS